MVERVLQQFLALNGQSPNRTPFVMKDGNSRAYSVRVSRQRSSRSSRRRSQTLHLFVLHRQVFMKLLRQSPRNTSTTPRNAPRNLMHKIQGQDAFRGKADFAPFAAKRFTYVPRKSLSRKDVSRDGAVTKCHATTPGATSTATAAASWSSDRLCAW